MGLSSDINEANPQNDLYPGNRDIHGGNMRR